MPVPTDQLSEEIGELTREVKDLSKGIADLRTESAGFRGGVESELKTIRWVGAFFTGGLFSVIIGAITVAWNAAVVVTDVRQQGTRLEKSEHRLDTFGENLQKQGARLEKIEHRLDTFGENLQKQGARLEKIEHRLDTFGENLQKQLDILIRRTEPKAGD